MAELKRANDQMSEQLRLQQHVGTTDQSATEALREYVSQLQLQHAAAMGELKKKHEAELMQMQTTLHRVVAMARK